MKNFFYSLCIFTLFASCSNDKKESELNVYLQELVPSLDPTFSTDRTSHKVISNIYEGLYSYHYLKRPLELEPVIAESLPTVSKDGLNYIIKIKKGVFFTDDPCFVAQNGKGREVVANDFIYSIKRFLASDKTKGMLLSQVLRETVVGVKEFIESRDTDKFNKEINGLIAKDTSTIEIKLFKTSVFFPSVLTRPNANIIAKEAVVFYGDKFSSHPVGTGPFILETNDSQSKLVLKKNLNYKHYLYPNSGTAEDLSDGILADAGKNLPFVDKLNLYILPEDQPRWLNFVKGNIDIALPDKDSYYNAFPMGELSKDLANAGVKVYNSKVFDVWFYAFNMENSILGKNKYLRQAITLAYDSRQHNTLFYNNNAILAHDLIPPGLFAYDASYTNPYTLFNLEKAKELMTKAGYPDGKGLPKFRFLIRETIAARQMGEFFAKSMAKIGVNIELVGLNFKDLLKKVYETRDFDLASLRWRADLPYAEDFLRLLYTKSFPNGPNHSRYSNKNYDDLYEKLVAMPNSDDKLTYFKKIRDIYTEDCPLIILLYPTNTFLTQSYVENFKTNPLYEDTDFKYIKINKKLKK